MRATALRRTIAGLVITATSAAVMAVGTAPAHADVWVGNEYAHTQVNCVGQSHTLEVTTQMTSVMPAAIDDGSILTPAPLPAYNRFWVYSWTTRSWLQPSKWIYTPGTAGAVVTVPSGWYTVYVQYAWAIRPNATTRADYKLAGEMLDDEYSYFPYLSATPRGFCFV